MANVINITDKLKRTDKYIELEGTEYKVDGSKNAFIEALAMMDTLSAENDFTQIDKIFERLCGKEFGEAVEALNLDIEDTKTVLIAVLAAAQGISYEEAEERFRKA